MLWEIPLSWLLPVQMCKKSTLLLYDRADASLGGVDVTHKVSSQGPGSLVSSRWGLNGNQHGWDCTDVSLDPSSLLALFLHSLAGVNIIESLKHKQRIRQFISLDPLLTLRLNVEYGVNNEERRPGLVPKRSADSLQVDMCMCVCIYTGIGGVYIIIVLFTNM